MTENQKLREALQIAESALADIGDADREPGDDLAWCERRAAQDLPTIRQALALITADHIPDAGEMVADQVPDAGKMIETAAPVGGYVRPVVLDARQALPTAEQVGDINVAESFTSVTKTAAPVGERELFERTMMDKFGWERKDFKTDARDFYMDGHTVTAFVGWRARAALSAGDAVDAVDAQRYRWLREQHWSNSDICCVNKPKQNVRLGGMCPSGDLLDAVIDAALRKGQL